MLQLILIMYSGRINRQNAPVLYKLSRTTAHFTMGLGQGASTTRFTRWRRRVGPTWSSGFAASCHVGVRFQSQVTNEYAKGICSDRLWILVRRCFAQSKAFEQKVDCWRLRNVPGSSEREKSGGVKPALSVLTVMSFGCKTELSWGLRKYTCSDQRRLPRCLVYKSRLDECFPQYDLHRTAEHSKQGMLTKGQLESQMRSNEWRTPTATQGGLSQGDEERVHNCGTEECQ